MANLLFILSFSLIVAPGAWIAFTLLDARTPYVVRLALAVALAPVCLGLQIILATQLGLSFSQASLASLLNIAAFWLMRPRETLTEYGHPSVWPIVAVSAVFATGLGLMWLLAPEFRIYSWHNMMQLAIVYGITDFPKPLEEFDLAGFHVNYAYIGHIQIAAIGTIGDFSPLKIFPIVNLATLFATVTLLCHTVDRLRPGHMASSAVATAVAMLSTNLAGVIYYLYLHGMTNSSQYFPTAVDIRVVTLVQKYMHFDLMTVGQALFAGAIFLAVVWLQSPSRRAGAGLIVCLAAIALVYPLLFPSGLLLAGAAWVAPHVLSLVSGKRLRFTANDIWAVLGLAAAAAVFVAHLALLSSPGGESVARRASVAEIIFAVKTDFVSLIVWAPLMALAVFSVWRRRDAVGFCLLSSAAASIGLSLVIHLPFASQYKFLVAGMFLMLPLIAVCGLTLLAGLGRAAAPAGVVIALGVALIMAPFMARHLVPWDMLRLAAPTEEQGFDILPAPQANAAWMAIVRVRTPRDAILLHPPSRDPLSIWTRRASYLAQDVGNASRIGYTMPTIFILTAVKSLPGPAIKARATVMRAIYDGDPQADFAALFDQLAALGRPIAIYGRSDLPFLGWLRAAAKGHAIFTDAAGTVWLIDGVALEKH